MQVRAHVQIVEFKQDFALILHCAAISELETLELYDEHIWQGPE